MIFVLNLTGKDYAARPIDWIIEAFFSILSLDIGFGIERNPRADCYNLVHRPNRHKDRWAFSYYPPLGCTNQRWIDSRQFWRRFI